MNPLFDIKQSDSKISQKLAQWHEELQYVCVDTVHVTTLTSQYLYEQAEDTQVNS